MGSRAAKRWPTLHTCHPTHSAFQWSTAANVPDPAVVHREHPHAVGPPHDVGCRGDDGPGVEQRIALAPAMGRKESVRSHHAQHTGAGDADPIQYPQPRVHLPMALALERRPSEVGANGRQQLLVRAGRLRPAARRALALLPTSRTSPPRVEGRTRALPHSTHPVDSIAAPAARGGRGAHRRDLRIGKGRRRSAARARSRSSSLSIDNSPMCRLAASSSAASGSPACAFRPSSRPASARAFHASRR